MKNIGQVVTERLNALRKLTANPDDSDAMNEAYAAQQKVCQYLLFNCRVVTPALNSRLAPLTVDWRSNSRCGE